MSDSKTLIDMQKAYARWAPIYDVFYDKLTEAGARAAVHAASSSGSVILEAGIGTGLAIEYYPDHVELYGVDLSEDMLKRAQDKVKKKNLTYVKSLRQMDVCQLDFPDAFFDAVCAQFIITLVPDPEKALAEFCRVLKPGGQIILVNHFGAPDGMIAKVEEFVAPVAKKVGWSSSFKASRVENWARETGQFEDISIKPVFPNGFFKLMCLRKKL